MSESCTNNVFLQYIVEQLPEGPAGQVYCVLSTANGNSTKVSDENTVAGVAILEIEEADW